MADQYRALVQSLMKLGFLFRRQGVGKREVWTNRHTDQEVTFDRQAVAASPALAAAVLKEAAGKPTERPVEQSGSSSARRAATTARGKKAEAPAERAAKAPAKSEAPAQTKVKSKTKGMAKGVKATVRRSAR